MTDAAAGLVLDRPRLCLQGKNGLGAGGGKGGSADV